MNFPSSIAFHRWRPAAWLRVTGADAADFLQGQFTNDLRAAASGAAVYGLWLSVKGKVVADSFVLRGSTADEFWIGSYFSLATVIRERLERFIIADDVTVADVTAEWTGVTLLGAGATAALAAGSREGCAFRGRRARDENLEWVLPVDRVDAVRAKLGALRELDVEEMLRRRIAGGIPAVPADIGPGDLPNEGGLDADAISFTKGCYLGQEVMARLKSMGQVRRRLLRVAGAGEAIPALPAPLFAGARKVGELRSAVRDGAGGFAGLALVSLPQLDPGAALALSADGVPAVRLRETP